MKLSGRESTPEAAARLVKRCQALRGELLAMLTEPGVGASDRFAIIDAGQALARVRSRCETVLVRDRDRRNGAGHA